MFGAARVANVPRRVSRDAQRAAAFAFDRALRLGFDAVQAVGAVGFSQRLGAKAQFAFEGVGDHGRTPSTRSRIARASVASSARSALT
jgi:hypothetical protein